MTKVEAVGAEALASAIGRLDVTVEHREILLRSVKNATHLWIGTHGETILCFFGLNPPTLLSDTAYLWLHSTPAMCKHSIPLMRHAIRSAKEWLDLYPHIVGHGHSNNPRSIRWLRLIGATFGEPTGSVIPFEIKAA